MKELSIEEKAKLYDEAIERAYSLLNGERKGDAWIHKLLPELAESEEEKLSKKLHECVCRAINNDKLPYEERKYISEQVIPYLENLEKQKEQKLQSKQEWREEDEGIRNEIIDYLERFIPHHEYDLVAKSRIWIDWLKKRKEPKATWSEEDEVMLRKIIQYIISLSEGCEVDLNDQINWLKSLKDRMALTNKNDFDRGYDVGISAAKFNQWKPTEEQMDALRDAVSGFPITDTDAIYSLYNDLKKL